MSQRVKKCNEPFPRQQGICKATNRNWKASGTNGPKGVLVAEVQHASS
jgi:hypothetical protein